MRYDLPSGLIVAGVLLTGAMVLELGALLFTPAAINVTAVANLITSLPFVFAILWIGRKSRSNIEPRRYPRIARWTIAGFVFLFGFFTIIAFTTQEAMWVRFGVIRWGAATGAGAGATIGYFEASAIDRAVALERTDIRNEELRRQNERLDEFAGILTHDLRNPLNVAQGRLAQLREDHPDETIDRIAVALRRMEEIIEDTLVLARSGYLIEDAESLSLSEIANQCMQTVRTRDATLIIESETTIVADPTRIRQLVENLVHNAVEHAGSDVTIRVGAIPTGFYIEDDGPGIPADSHNQVFESGFTTKSGGTGLGLAIVEQIGEAHGWTLTLTTSSEGGARFEFSGVESQQPTGSGDAVTATEPAK